MSEFIRLTLFTVLRNALVLYDNAITTPGNSSNINVYIKQCFKVYVEFLVYSIKLLEMFSIQSHYRKDCVLSLSAGSWKTYRGAAVFMGRTVMWWLAMSSQSKKLSGLNLSCGLSVQSLHVLVRCSALYPKTRTLG